MSESPDDNRDRLMRAFGWVDGAMALGWVALAFMLAALALRQ